MQRFSIILWARPYEKDMPIEEMTDFSFQILSALQNYGWELAPKYLPARKKSLVKEFELNHDNVKARLEKAVNKADYGEQIFWDLGRHISFFSSLDDKLSSRISLTVGVSNNQFINSLVVSLPREEFSGFNARKTDFEGLFRNLIILFNPYFAFIVNKRNEQISEGFWDEKKQKPTYVHWMNYYDATIAKNIGAKKLLALEEMEKLGNGYFYKLQDEPIDINNPQHMQRQKEITQLLCL
jgi:hypothetical protein